MKKKNPTTFKMINQYNNRQFTYELYITLKKSADDLVIFAKAQRGKSENRFKTQKLKTGYITRALAVLQRAV